MLTAKLLTFFFLHTSKPPILGGDDRRLIDSCQGEGHKNKEN